MQRKSVHRTTATASASIGQDAAQNASPRINGDISDLFFNTNLSAAELPVDRDGVSQGYDRAKLAIEAELFLNCLYRLGVPIPSAQSLIANFYSRI